MRELAQTLSHLHERAQQAATPDIILGSAGRLSQALRVVPEFRVGVWPCVSDDMPEIAMGLMTALAYLLEQWQGIRAYRVFAMLDGDPQDYSWTISQSQFTVDDWQFDGLDDNVGLWGTLSPSDVGWVLHLEVENDLLATDETHRLSYTAATPAALIDTLPEAARTIVAMLNPEAERIQGGIFSAQPRAEQAVNDLLEVCFLWELALLSSLWGRAIDLAAAYQDVLDAARTLGEGDDFAAWIVASATARLLLPGFLEQREAMPEIHQLIAALPKHALAAGVMGQALFRAGESQFGYELLEQAVELQPQNPASWLMLATAYRIGGRPMDAVDAFQRAIEADAVSSTLLVTYASLLPLMQAQGYRLTEFIMIDLEQINADHMTWEAIEAYDEALSLSPTDPALIRARQIQLMLEVDDEDRLWAAFGDLVRIDPSGEQVRATVDELIALDDVAPAIAVLEAAASEQPDRADLKANLAALYLADEDYSSAHDMLTAAETQTSDAQWRADIQRMMLAVEDPDFEAKLGEIIDRLEADNGLTEDQVDLLEWAVERAPTYAEVYVLLARAYVLWEDEPAAIETLLEADKRIPNDPEVILLLSTLLWEGEQHELAFSYLRRGVSASPLHVPMLAKFGLYLFEDEQYDSARDYLARAGAIAARHPALIEVRAEIAQRLNDDELRDRLFYDYDQD